MRRLAHEGEIGDGDDAPVVRRGGVAIAIPEGVELLDVAELEPCLLANPGAQAELERPVLERVERTERQRWEAARDMVHGKHPRNLFGHGEDDGVEPDPNPALRHRACRVLENITGRSYSRCLHGRFGRGG